MSSSDLEQMLAQLRQEFLDGCEDRFNEMDGAIMNILDGKGSAADNLLDLQRQLHSIKGTAGTHDLSALSTIAHVAEDYIEAVDDMTTEAALRDVQAYVDMLRAIVDKRLSPSDQETEAIIAGLPKPGAVAPTKELTGILVMPPGTQRKIIATQMADKGYRLTMAKDGITGLQVALSRQADLVLASMELSDMTGADLARALGAIRATAGTPFVLMTAYDPKDARVGDLPDKAACLHKGDAFEDQLAAQLKAWKLV